MKYSFCLLCFSLFPFMVLSGYSQSSLSIGAIGGFGFSVPSKAVSYTSNGVNSYLRGNAFYSLGVLGQYILGDRLGIETGFLNNYQQYSPMNSNSFKSFLSIDSSLGIINHQIPIQLLFKFNHPTDPYKHF